MTPDPLFDFTGKVALITGGSRGLGREMVLALAQRGADIIVASRKQDACDIVAEEVRTMGRRALAHAAHCGRWDEIDALIEAAYGAFGRVEVENVLAVEPHVARRRLIAFAAGDDVGERRFAGAVRPHDGRDFAGPDAERQALEDFPLADGDVEVPNFKHSRSAPLFLRHGRP